MECIKSTVKANLIFLLALIKFIVSHIEFNNLEGYLDI